MMSAFIHRLARLKVMGRCIHKTHPAVFISSIYYDLLASLLSSSVKERPKQNKKSSERKREGGKKIVLSGWTLKPQ